MGLFGERRGGEGGREGSVSLFLSHQAERGKGTRRTLALTFPLAAISATQRERRAAAAESPFRGVFISAA